MDLFCVLAKLDHLACDKFSGMLGEHEKIDPRKILLKKIKERPSKSEQGYSQVLGVFLWFRSQFPINFPEIWQALFASILAPTLNISWNVGDYFESLTIWHQV